MTKVSGLPLGLGRMRELRERQERSGSSVISCLLLRRIKMVHQSDNYSIHNNRIYLWDSRLLQTARRFHASEILRNTRSNVLNEAGQNILPIDMLHQHWALASMRSGN